MVFDDLDSSDTDSEPQPNGLNGNDGPSNTGEQEAWRVRIQRRLDPLNDLELLAPNTDGLKRQASAPEQHATRRYRISPRSSESNDAVATNISVHSTVTEELSVPLSGQFAPCPQCRVSESRHDQSDFRIGDWVDIDVWVDLAFRGCNYCRIIASGAIRNFRPYRRAPDNIKLRVRALAGPFRNMVIDMRSRNDDIQSWEFHITKGDSYRYSVFGPYSRVWSKPSKESQVHKAACAIQDCVKNHKACHQNSSEVPSRLIELSIVKGENMLRLVDTQTLAKGSKQRYIALSHCWGSGQPLRLLKSNLASMKARIPWAAFPRLFRNAIELTWSLGVRYLWIDALCIIQDNSLDWQVESARMGDIYRSSFVTVLASPASDSSGTIFAENGESLLAGETSYITQVQSFQRRTSIVKLHTRAWTFQEFLLPRRVLEFGYSGEEFHCCDTESRNKRFYPETSGIWSERLYRARFDFNNVLKSHNANDKVWYQIIKDYAARDLTQLQDRLPALSGLASLYLKQTGLKGRYLAGLWQRSFLRGLHWAIPSEEIYFRKFAHTINRYHAPSWSWSSLTRPVVYLQHSDLLSDRDEYEIDSGSRPDPVKARGVDHSSTGVSQSFAQVIHVQCEIKGSNPFGEVTGGTAVLRGLLLDARMSFHSNIDGSTSPLLQLMDSAKFLKCSGYGGPGHPEPMLSWVKKTALPYLPDNHYLYLDSEVEMVPASQSLPRTCAYLRRCQLERQVDGLSEAWAPEETNRSCLHVSVLILSCADHSERLHACGNCITGLVLGRPDPEKEVYERLGLFRFRCKYDLKVEPKHLIGAVKDVTII